MDNRRYIKRVWRVPKDRGALEYFATLLVKALVKHGWPATWEPVPFTDGFVIQEKGKPGSLPADFENAVAIAARITARTYRVQISQHTNWIGLDRHYTVTNGGHFKPE